MLFHYVKQLSVSRILLSQCSTRPSPELSASNNPIGPQLHCSVPAYPGQHANGGRESNTRRSGARTEHVVRHYGISTTCYGYSNTTGRPIPPISELRQRLSNATRMAGQDRTRPEHDAPESSVGSLLGHWELDACLSTVNRALFRIT